MVVPTYNSEVALSRLLSSVELQHYPKDAIEIIVVDGGSADGTVKVAASYGAKIIQERTGRPEMATAIGYKEAIGDFILNLPSDNVLPHQDWISQMIEPFDQNKEVVAAQTLRYSYRKDLGTLDRYFALFGAGDPLSYYLGKRDRISWFEKGWTLFGRALDKGKYFLVRFEPNRVPTLGANGYMVRRRVIHQIIGNPADFFHIDSNVDLINAGYNLFAIVKNDILHLSAESILGYFSKRLRYMKIYQRDKRRRRYHLYNPATDKLALSKFVLISLTFIFPLVRSIRAYRISRDSACFVHPLLCFLTLIFYAVGTVPGR